LGLRFFGVVVFWTDNCEGSMVFSLGCDTSSAWMLYSLCCLAAFKHLKVEVAACFASNGDLAMIEDGIVAETDSAVDLESQEPIDFLVLVVCSQML